MVAVARGGAAPTTLPALEPIAQLAVGKSAGTFHLVYPVKVQFSDAGHCALVGSISDYADHEIASFPIGDRKDFTFETDLRPGTYEVSISPADRQNPDYWPSPSQRIHINKGGQLYQPHDWFSTSGIFVLDARMKGVSPADEAVAGADPPLLTWPAIAGAAHYRGEYMFDRGQKWFDVDEARYQIGGGIAAGASCWWTVKAVTDDGKVIARYEGYFGGNGTAPEKIAQVKMARTKIAQTQPAIGPPDFARGIGRACLGIATSPGDVPKDPSQAIEYGAEGSRVIPSDAIPGIEVSAVMPGSPAIDADLLPDDVIIAVDGQRIASNLSEGDRELFTRQLSVLKPGKQITLTVRRFPRELTIQVTLGLRPGATTLPVGVAEQDVFVGAAADDTMKAGWFDVGAGTPTITPLVAKPGVDVMSFSEQEGVPASGTWKVVELPNGGYAFGSRRGLSIWDGKEVRTYTGPEYFSRGIEINGNSGLPSNHIQDLLVDSKGRLWCATHSGVCRIDPAKDGHWRVLVHPGQGAFDRNGNDSALDVQKIFEMSDGTIVLGGRNAAITLIDPKTDEPKLIHHDDDMNHWVSGMTEDSRHRLWIAMDGVGVFRYDGRTVEQLPANEKWFTDTNLLGLCIDGAGTVWVASYPGGLGALHPDGTAEKVPADQLPGQCYGAISTDRLGRVWASTDGGLAVYAPNDAKGHVNPWKYFALDRPDGYENVLVASDGSLWVGTSPIVRQMKWSLSSVNPSVEAVQKFKSEIGKTYPNVKPSATTAVGVNGIVVGLAARQLFTFDGTKWENLNQTIGPLHVGQIFTDSRKTIWIATEGEGLLGIDATGIHRFNDDEKSSKSVIHCLAEAPDGTMYAGTQDGVYRSTGKDWTKIETDQPLWQVTELLVDRRGRVWLLEITDDIIYVYDGKRFRDASSQTALDNHSIGNLRLDDAGNVLVDVGPAPRIRLPKSIYRWDATVAGTIGPPQEAK
jgi:ligand-binding sensor domain-containing protein